MVLLQARPVADDFRRYESTFTTQYSKWNGFVARNPVLKSIIDIRAASVCSSWKTHGTNAKAMAKSLDAWRGRGDETFKLIIGNLYKIAYVCGDAYGEIIYDGDTPVDLHVLPSDNIRQVIKDGKILRFEELDGGMKWQPERLFHITYGKRGAMTHGIGQIQAMQNILVDYEQMLQQGSEIFRLFTKPMQIVYAKTDQQAKLNAIRDQLKDNEDTFSRTIVMPQSLIDKVDTISLSIPLQPGDWLKVLREEIFMSTQTTEQILGVGTVNSEEAAIMQMAGFRGSIRYDQKWLEENIRKQIFEQAYPDGTPDIKWSFATEGADERFRRSIEAGTAIQGWQISPENKAAITADILSEAGLIEE